MDIKTHENDNLSAPRFTAINFFDDLNPALQRAAAIADLLEIASATEGHVNHETLQYAAQAIYFELADAKSILRAHWLASKKP